jgi:hypothetical protein
MMFKGKAVEGCRKIHLFHVHSRAEDLCGQRASGSHGAVKMRSYESAEVGENNHILLEQASVKPTSTTHLPCEHL